MIDLKTYDFYNFNYNDFIKDWFIYDNWIYWNSLYKKENDKIIVLYINYNKDRIIDLFIFENLKDKMNIDYTSFYNSINNNWKYELKKELKHINKNIKIKENYNFDYDIYTKIYKNYIWYKYTIDKLFNKIDIFNFLFDKYYLIKALDYIN